MLPCCIRLPLYFGLLCAMVGHVNGLLNAVGPIFFTVRVQIYIDIRHRAARRARACSGQCLTAGLSDCLLLRGPQPRGRFYSRGPQTLFGTLFAFVCSDLICYNEWYHHVSKWVPQNNPKSQKTTKKHNHNAPTVKTCKNTLSGRDQTFKIDDS